MVGLLVEGIGRIGRMGSEGWDRKDRKDRKPLLRRERRLARTFLALADASG
jgi:hypothetical protein